MWSVSVLAGSSGAMPGSDLRRRSRNGPIRSANCRALVGSSPDSMGPAHTLRKALRLPSRPGIAQSRIDHSSVRSFSTGVPVSATRARLGIGAQGAGRGGPGVLDVLRLVGDDQVPRHLGEERGVVAHRAVGGEHEAVGHAVEVAGAAVVAAYGDSRGEATDLGLPVAEQRRRADHERRARHPLSGAVQVQRDEGDRLAEPHVVGQAGAEAHRGQLGQPAQARGAGSRGARPAARPVRRRARRSRRRGAGRGPSSRLAPTTAS